ncbi:MAG: hypothetical protein WBA74_14640, partial [Cyclobacteriaceae bacterium]
MRLTINRKLIIFTGGIAVLLLVIGFSIYGSFSRTKGIINTSIALKEIQVNVVKLREAEKNMLLWELKNNEYYQSGQSEYQQSFYQQLAANVALIKNLSDSDLSEDYGIRKQLQTLLQKHDAYKSKFDKLVALKKQRGFGDYGIIGEMREIMHELEENYESLRNQNDILQMRRHEKDYLLRQDRSYYDKALDLANNIEARASGAFAAKVAEYMSLYGELIALEEAIGTDERSGIYAELNEIYSDISMEATTLIDEINQKSEEGRDRTTLIIAILILGGAVMAILIGLLITKGINNSINRATGAIARIAEGELDVTLE